MRMRFEVRLLVVVEEAAATLFTDDGECGLSAAGC